jgi:hypothetical protein
MQKNEYVNVLRQKAAEISGSYSDRYRQPAPHKLEDG